MDRTRLVETLTDLADVMARLRAECPWDRRQTPETLRRYLVEECYEVLEALDAGDREALRGELGDLLFQIWFHAEMASEQEGGFDLSDVAAGIAAKLRRRHPHVFGDETADTAAHVKRNWERIKAEEKGRTSRLDGVPRELPALLAAQCLQEKASAVGFDWPDVTGALDKVEEEVAEVRAELAAAPPDDVATEAVEAELGDLLFALVNYARHQGIAPEDALRRANRKFARRFRHVEAAAAGIGTPMDDMSLEELERLWQRAKDDLG